MKTRSLFFFICTIFISRPLLAQTGNDIPGNVCFTNIDNSVFDELKKQYSSLQSKLNKASAKLLSKMQYTEGKLQSKLMVVDSVKTGELFNEDVKQQYRRLQNSITATIAKAELVSLKEYLPGVDSVQTGIKFLMSSSKLPPGQLGQLQSLTAKFQLLECEIQNANEIQAFIKEREVMLKEQLMHTALSKQLLGINKQAYYYETELATYKSLLNDKEKLKDKLLEAVRNLPAFKEFWQKNSYLAALFPMPSNYGTSQALAGLQTRSSVQNVIAQSVSTTTVSGANGQQYFQQSIDAAQAELNKLKDKLNKFSRSNGSSNMAMPDFKPNDQKNESFFKRLEYGFNIQSEARQYGLPATSDLALTLGYKLSDNKRFGIGASYKLGWGNGFQDVHITSEGIGLRSYVDVKAKGSIWLSSGFEYNYLSRFKSLQDLHDNVDVWQRSALAGLSKKYKIGRKEGNIQLLYDFLHNLQTPPSGALKFRAGCTF